MKALIDKLCAEKAETEWLEFKVNNFNPQLIGEYLSALSNSACLCGRSYGYLVFGITDKTHKLVGTKFNPRTAKGQGNEGLEPWLTLHLSPRIDFKIIEYNYDKNHIVIFRIDATLNTPVRFSGIAYVRIGEHKHKLSDHPEKERKIWKYNQNYDWSAQIIVEATLNDLDENAISMARKHFKEKNLKLASDVDGWSVFDFLNKAKITIRNQITNTAILLLGKPESEHFLAPSKAQITWILKNNTDTKVDYEHFFPPFLTNVEQAVNKIRNLKFRYIITNTLFPTEIFTYDPWVIREALHNCVAHQDYGLSGRIIITEEPDCLVFSNLGSFLPQKIENVILQEFSLEKLRNRFLSNAMVNLNMIDTIGSGIYRMFRLQKERFFPLPDYEIFSEKIKVTILGKIIDENYTKLLIQKTDLDIWKVFLLDQVQKKKQISKSEHKTLKIEGLVEGRYPNLFISQKIANATEQKADYIKAKAFNEKYYIDLVTEFLKKHKKAKKNDLEELLLNKLSDRLTEIQKKNKISNLKGKMRNLGIIKNIGSRTNPIWVLKDK